MGELKIYEIGDKVTCDLFGAEEFVLQSSNTFNYPLMIARGEHRVSFTTEGKIISCAVFGSLNLVSRPKKKVKREFRKVIFRHKNGKVYETDKPYDSREAFEAKARETAIGNLLLGGAYSYGDSISEEELEKQISKFLYFTKDQQPLILEVEE